MNKNALYQDVVKFIRVSGELMKRAQTAEETKTAESEKLAKLIPEAVAAAVDNEKILPAQEEKLASKLQSHASTIEFLRDVCRHRRTKEASDIGELVKPIQDQKPSRVRGAKIADYDETSYGRTFRARILGTNG